MRVIYLVEYVAALGLSVTLPSLWPFVDHVGGSTTDLGWIVTVGSFGAVVGSPLCGKLSDMLGVKPVLLLSMWVSIGGSILYAMSVNTWMLLVSRFITGVAIGRQTVCQSYIVRVTTREERTSAMSILGGLTILGTATGPAIGTALSFAQFKIGSFEVADYNSCGYAWALTVLINIAMVSRWFRTSLPAVSTLPVTAAPATTAIAKPPAYLVCRLSVSSWYCVSIAFLSTFCYINLETLLPPMLDNFYSWGVTENGIVWTLAAVVGVIAYISMQLLSKRVSDRMLALLGILLFGVGSVLYAPFPWDSQVYSLDAFFSDTSTIYLPLWRMGLATAFMVVGYCYSDAVVNSMYSKSVELDLGSHTPGQPTSGSHDTSATELGNAMGFFNAAQSMAFTLGPLVGTAVYDRIGPQLFFFQSVVLVVCCMWTMCMWGALRRTTGVREDAHQIDLPAETEFRGDDDGEPDDQPRQLPKVTSRTKPVASNFNSLPPPSPDHRLQ